MIKVLEIVASSWPIAIMFLGLMGCCIALYVVRWFKKSDEDKQAYYRSSQAVTVREWNRDESSH